MGGFKIRQGSKFLFTLIFSLVLFTSLNTVCASDVNPISYSDNITSNSSKTWNWSDTQFEGGYDHSNDKNNNAGLIFSSCEAAGSPYNDVNFNTEEVMDTASYVKNFIEINHDIPVNIDVNGTNVNIYSFYYFLSTVVQNIYNNNNNPVELLVFSQPQIVKEDIHSGNVPLSEYIQIADAVKVYMDRTSIVPGYAYGTSVGPYFNYKSLIYMYSKILDVYHNTRSLPQTVDVKPWKILSDPNARSYTNQQVITTANWLKNYIETNHQLPTTVPIDGTNINIYTFYYLLTTTVQNLNTNNNNPIDTTSYNSPQALADTIHSGTMTLNEYIHIADVTKVYMDKTGIVPGYACQTSLGTYMGWENLAYTFSKILTEYTTQLPTTTTVKPWKILSDPNARSYTNQQVITTANWLKNYIETNHQLPTTVPIDGTNINIYTFYYLLTTTVQNLNTNNNNNPIDTTNINAPQIVNEDIHLGDLSKVEYIKIADAVKVYMDKTGIVPGYAYGTSIGLYFSYKSLIYTYCKILDNFNTNSALPCSVWVKPWKIVTDPSIPYFTNDEVIKAAIWVKDYIEIQQTLPSKVTIDGKDVTMPTFLEMISTVVQNLYNKSSDSVDGIPFNSPQILKEEIHMGSMSLSEYIKIADDVKVYMDTTWTAPGYAYNTGLGFYLGYHSLVYMYCQILSEYNNTKTLPITILVRPWNKFRVDEIALVAYYVKSYVESSHGLPSTVMIEGINVGLPSFLQILVNAVLLVKNNMLSTLIDYNYCNPPQTLNEQMNYGDMSLTEYLKIAGDVKSYTESTWIMPGYAYGTSLGTYFSCYNMIYTYCKVLNYYHYNKVLPTSVSVQPWSSILLPRLRDYPSNLVSYTWPTINCQSDDPTINNIAYWIIATSSSSWDAGNRILAWVRDNVEYAFYYNTLYGARGTLNNLQGNCVDQTHLVIALARAVGIPARYVHGTCYFIVSGNWYGHVWADIFIDGGWVSADATSYKNELSVIKNWDTGSCTIHGFYQTLPF